MADPGDVVTVAYLLTIVAFPIRSIGWMLGEFPRSVVGFERVQRVLDTVNDTTYGDERIAAPPTRRRSSSSTTSATPTRRARCSSRGSTSPSSRAAPSPSWARPPRGRARSPRSSPGWSTRSRARSGSTATTCATSPRGELAEHVALVPQSAFLFDDTVRGNVTLGADVPDEEVWEALRTAQADGFVAGLPRRAGQPAR